ncbi:MAG: TAXI family TRAP transporter solute-binding subunit [Hyphomicrobiaceae bacterium]
MQYPRRTLFALAASAMISAVFMGLGGGGGPALAQTAVNSAPMQIAQAEPTADGDARRNRIVVAQAPRRSNYRSQSEQSRKEAINSNTVGLAAGRIEGAPLRFAAELARAMDDGNEMRVLPIVTRGIFDNIFDLLYLRGVDAAIVYGDVLEYFKKNPEISSISKRINYLTSLFPAELHIMVRPEIKSLADLAGKAVNFNTEGTAAAYSGPIIFERLGIKVDAKFIPHSVAIGEMKKSDKFAAVVFISSKPIAPFIKGNWPPGFHFLPVQYTDALDYYMPAYLEHSDYPGLIPEGQRITTIAVPVVLAVYDWPTDTERFRRMKKFVKYLHERLPILQTKPGYHPAWKNVNLAARVPGWDRFGPLQEFLDKVASERPKPAARASAAVRQEVQQAAPNDPEKQKQLFEEFLQWKRRQQQ